MKRKTICAGLLAHVDAGKTTLSESMLHQTGRIKKAGRVDHKDAFLDTHELEKERGITIFSKQAVLATGETDLFLLDTPGHVDFSAEMERTLQVLDYAVLVISGTDGVQGHTLTLWKLLERYQLPVFLFVNKMDQPGTDRDALLYNLGGRLSDAVMDFSGKLKDEGFCGEMLENLAVLSEETLEEYMETGTLAFSSVRRLIFERKLFPVFFGSALRETGVEDLLVGLDRLTCMRDYPDTFGARVFKIGRDDKGNRLTYLKVTGGRLRVKMPLLYRTVPLSGEEGQEEESREEKIDQIRIYSGAKYETREEIFAGMVCAVTGLSGTFPGQGLGADEGSPEPVLAPVLDYHMQLPSDVNPHVMFHRLLELQEEDPSLHIRWEGKTGEIHVMLMGAVQTEILRSVIWERFHTAVDFGAGQVVYKETIAGPVEGVGHFEPLRHYAEVHLLLEPGERGSGIQVFTACSEDVLDRNWQRLILTHLLEKEHVGVLTGAAVTDIQITLLTGKAHLKHTEGGDFRQATYRAVRQGLRKARSVLLEPYYEFTLMLPADCLGRAMTDVQRMQGSFRDPEQDGEYSVLKGMAPVEKMRDYFGDFSSYTRGMGRFFCSLSGYYPCKDQEEIVRQTGYDPEADLANPTGSVFCAHGAGIQIPWYQVEEYMHLPGIAADPGMEEAEGEASSGFASGASFEAGSRPARGAVVDEDELLQIFERTYGPVRRRVPMEHKRVVTAPKDSEWKPAKRKGPVKEYLLVDGYNIIFAWKELKELAGKDIKAAQGRLMDILSDFQGSRGMTLILVFDAYKVEGHREEVLRYHNIHVVYTKEAETADQYIEKTVHQLGKGNAVTVATSDGLEQIIILGQGARRLSAAGLLEEVQLEREQVLERIREERRSTKTSLSEKMKEVWRTEE